MDIAGQQLSNLVFISVASSINMSLNGKYCKRLARRFFLPVVLFMMMLEIKMLFSAPHYTRVEIKKCSHVNVTVIQNNFNDSTPSLEDSHVNVIQNNVNDSAPSQEDSRLRIQEEYSQIDPVWENYTQLIITARDVLLKTASLSPFRDKPFKDLAIFQMTGQDMEPGVTVLKDDNGHATATGAKITLQVGPFTGGFSLVKEHYYRWTITADICRILTLQDPKGNKKSKFRPLCQKHTDVKLATIPRAPEVTTGDWEMQMNYMAMRHRDIYVLIRRQGVIDATNGCVYSGRYCYRPRQCKIPVYGSEAPPAPESLRSLPKLQEVFVLTQSWGTEYFHWTVEALPRLVFYIPFLVQHKHIKIHVPRLSEDVSTQLGLLGIGKSRLVSGAVRAAVWYMPQGGSCGEDANPIATTVLSNLYLPHITRFDTAASRARNLIVLIQRSKKRKLQQHEQMARMLQEEASKFGLALRVFSDDPVPRIKETMTIFNRAVLVVAPHGAGLANLIYSKTGTAVIEILCGSNINLCFQRLSTAMGMKYHGVTAKGCENMVTNITYVQSITNMFLANAAGLYT